VRFLLQIGALLAFVWFLAHQGPVVAMVISATVAVTLMVVDIVRNPKSSLYNLSWGGLAGAAFILCAFGYPVAFLVIFRDWTPSLSREWLKRSVQCARTDNRSNRQYRDRPLLAETAEAQRKLSNAPLGHYPLIWNKFRD
jgi:hypothetical protein